MRELQVVDVNSAARHTEALVVGGRVDIVTNVNTLVRRWAGRTQAPL